jgi:hypothetical protein
VAARYDESIAEMFEPSAVDPVVDFLMGLAGDGAALELGIGTGRIAVPLAQRGVRVHGSVVDSRLDAHSVPFRYVWPSELDLMARFTGMALRGRWAGWKREPFTSESTKHVSVWQKSAT